ncbi:uncharacterized protein LOC141729660 isoform X2 [Zonotrichia albicollis]|uniref:uncharacterized protein LOC141729660 isoform X2 n=1 Tax=Zonotrichia albicollis TaxID=44394 RepID=UPI003D80DEA6
MEALRRPALPEDAVRYRLFAAAGPGGEALLRRCAELSLVRFAPLLAAYVWQRQPFRLRYVPGRGEIPAHLGGTTEFGDNVEDEWFIVYLLREITREFPGLAASCDEVSPGDEILALLQTTPIDVKELEREAACLPAEDGADSEELDSDDVDEEEEFGFSDEDDEELDAGNGRQEQKVSPEELVGSLKAYMEEMDRELAQSNVGKSFSSHKRGASSVGAAPCESAGPDCGAEAAELAALDVDMNLVANLLESYSAQAGLAGPTSSILQSLGVNLPESTELPGS